MTTRLQQNLVRLRRLTRQVLLGPTLLALLPVLVLGGYWIGGERALVVVALGYPLCLTLAGLLNPSVEVASVLDASINDRAAFEAALALATDSAVQSSRRTGCVLLEIDDYDEFLKRFGKAATETAISGLTARLASVLRSRDHIGRLGENLFGVAIGPVRQLDLGNALHLASRLQNAMEEPIVIDGITVYISASVGLALDINLREKSGPALLHATETALAEARRHGPSAMRAYSQEMHAPSVLCDTGFTDEISDALNGGQIGPWFQPQISTDTGRVTGFEALARWTHPERGMISPAEFLPALEQASQMERLGEVMLYSALTALKSWDNAGLDVPQVGVNFSPEELRNPNLVKKIEWELDRFELSPQRLNVEILETVVATSPDDTVVRNISGLAALGCLIDLDDFGTGHASISSIRRFEVQRLKIDRSFIMKVDRDADQQRMVSAILLMAERLGLDTLAEGVETAGEHAMLAQLGCGHVQGYGIARPMPPDQTEGWVRTHLAKLDDPPAIGRQIN